MSAVVVNLRTPTADNEVVPKFGGTDDEGALAMSVDSVTDSPTTARMVCEMVRGVLLNWPGEPPRRIPAGTKFMVEEWVGGGWYRGRLPDDPRPTQMHARDLGLPSGS